MGRRHVPARRRARRRHADRAEVRRSAPARSRSPSPRWPPIGRCCCSAFPAPPRRGSASTSPPPSAATRRCSSRAPPAPPRSRCATAGTTPACSPRARARRRSCRARCTGRCAPAGSCGSRSSPACRPTCRTRSSPCCREKMLPVPELDTEVAAVQRLQPHRHGQRSRPRHQRAVQRAAPAVQHRRAAAAGHGRGGDGDRGAACRRARRGAALPAVPAAVGGDPPRRHHLPRAARGTHRRRPHQPEGADRHAVDRRGDLGGHQRSGAGRALRRRHARRRRRRRRHRRCGRPRSRCTTTSRGASTSRGWCATATAGATSTTPAANSAERRRELGPPSGCTCSGSAITGPGRRGRCCAALDEMRPDVGAGRAAGRRRARCAGSATPSSCRRWRCSATSSPTRRRRRSGRSPSSARSGRRSVGPRARRARRRSTCRCARRWPRRDDGAAGAARVGEPPPDPLGRWPGGRRARRRSAGGRTSSSTAAMARRRSMRSPRRWPRCAAARSDAAARRSTRGAHAAGDPAPRSPTARARSRWCAGPGTCPRSTRRRPRPRPTRRRCAGRPEGRRSAVTWVPWTHRRLGAALGLRRRRHSPGWYAPRLPSPGPGGRGPLLRRRRRTPCAPRACRRRPTTSSRASRLADALAALRDRPRAGLAEVLDAAEVGGSAPGIGAASLDSSSSATRSARCRRTRRRCRWPATSPRRSGGAADAEGRPRRGRARPAHAQRAAPLAPAAPAGRRSVSSGGARRRAGVPAARSARRGGAVGAGDGRAPRRVRRLRHDGGGAATAMVVEQATAAGRLVDAALWSTSRCSPTCRRRSAGVRGSLGELAAHAPDVAELIDALVPLAGALRYGDVRGTDSSSLRDRVRRDRRARHRRAGPGVPRRSTTTPRRR